MTSCSWIRRELIPNMNCKRNQGHVSVRSLLFRTLVLGAFAAIVAGCSDQNKGLVISGRVEVDNIHVGSKIGGRVARVNFEEGDDVKAGQPVVTLEDDELSASLNQALASAAQAKSQLDLLLAGTRKEDIQRAEAVVKAHEAELQLRRKGFRDEEVRETIAQLASATSTLALAEKEYHRAEDLRKSGVTEQSELDKRRTEYETAKAAVDVATHRMAIYQSGSRPEEISMAEAELTQAQADAERLKNGARPEEIAAQQAAVAAANANAERLKSQLAETQIRAPVDCTVETLDLKVGDLVKAGETMAVLNFKRRPWVRCYVPENRMGFVKPGQEVSVTVDSFPGKTFKAKVRRINSEAEFTPRNVQTNEKRAELVFEMKADVLEGGEDLRAGMYADVSVPGAPR